MECSKCNELFDLPCLNIKADVFKTYTLEYKNGWVCPVCNCAKPKGDNTLTPVRASTGALNITYTSEDNVTLTRGNRSKSADNCAKNTSDVSTLIGEIRLLRQEVLELKSQNNELGLLRHDMLELKEQINKISTTLGDKFQEIDEKFVARDNEIILLKGSIAQLQHKLNVQEQTTLRNDLEISGIPEHENENLMLITTLLSKKIGVELSETDVDGVSRVGRRKQPGTISSEQHQSRPIVVKLVRKAKRTELMMAAKVRRNLTSESIVEGSAQRVYLNERLTKENRKLFRESRTRSQQFGFRYCWIRNGSIYIRKADKKPAILITSEQDLDDHIGSESQPTTNISTKL